MRGVVLINQLRQAQRASHARRPAADDDYVGGHLRAFDAFDGFAEDQAHEESNDWPGLAISPRPSNF